MISLMPVFSQGNCDIDISGTSPNGISMASTCNHCEIAIGGYCKNV
jgi:hypothetical protein